MEFCLNCALNIFPRKAFVNQLAIFGHPLDYLPLPRGPQLAYMIWRADGLLWYMLSWLALDCMIAELVLAAE